jgi:type I protein arginine methyltransferase
MQEYNQDNIINTTTSASPTTTTTSLDEKTRPNPALGLARILATAAAHGYTSKTTTTTEDEQKSLNTNQLIDFRSPGAHDAHPFFSYYGQLVHQQNMMQDMIRTSAYHNAITSNPTDFMGATVMDVGTGSGILAYFAAKAGASTVWAIEASGVATHARTLMAANGYADRVKVIQAKVEEVKLPDNMKVDILISEPMGFMLIHERMLESYMIARQMFLKPGGRMFPSTGTIFAAPFTDATLWNEQSGKVSFWHNTDFFGLDISSLANAAARDHFAQPVVGLVDPSSLLSSGRATKVIDFLHDDPESLHDMELTFDFVIEKTEMCHGLALWYV